MPTLTVDRYSPAELRALDAYAQLSALDELFGEMKRLADLKVEAIGLHAAARIHALNENRKPTECPKVIEGKCNVDKLATIITARRQQISILQTILRSPAA